MSYFPYGGKKILDLHVTGVNAETDGTLNVKIK